MATGDLLLPLDGACAKPKAILMPPEDAAAEALAAYLRKACFYIGAGSPDVGEFSRLREFQLAEVATDWPEPDVQLKYPSATIFGRDDTQHTGSGTPRPMEGSWDEYAGSVPWNLGIALGTFQVDFWTDSAPVRQAIAARLPGLFNPGENRAGILLELPPAYLCLAGRFTLVTKGRTDSSDTIYAGEHRLRAVVSWEVPDVMLRAARALRLNLPTQTTTPRDGPREPGAQT